MENNLENISQLLEIDLRENETLVQHNKTKAKILARLDIIEYNVKNQQVFLHLMGLFCLLKQPKDCQSKRQYNSFNCSNNDVYAEV